MVSVNKKIVLNLRRRNVKLAEREELNTNEILCGSYSSLYVIA
jgi:hypothetical protein